MGLKDLVSFLNTLYKYFVPPFPSKIFSGVLLQMSSFTCLWYSSKHPQQFQEESSTAWLRVSVSKFNILSFLKSVRLSKKKSEASKVMTSEVKCQVIILISYARVLRNWVNQFETWVNFCVSSFFFSGMWWRTVALL